MRYRDTAVFAMLALCFFVISCGPREDSDAGGSTETDADSLRTVPVRARVVRQEHVEEAIEVTGVIAPHRSVDVVAETGGRLVRVRANVGHRVSAGDTLAVIDDRVAASRLEHAKAQVLSARNKLKIARLNFESDGQLLDAGDISKLAFETSRFAVKSAEAELKSNQAELSRARKGFEDTRLTSPIDGRISRKHVELGAMTSVGKAAYRVVDLTTMKIKLGIPQPAIGRVTPGGSVRITVDALGGLTFDGYVRYVSPQAEEATGAFPVEVHLANTPGMTIRGGMAARCRVILRGSGLQFVVPGNAVVAREDKEYIYRIRDGIARLSEVKTRDTFGAHVAVEAGIEEGDSIVVAGMNRLGTATRVTVRAAR
ncbi:MAG: efflux RND transporter periplasmic adaptor subunit [Gemmatimonadota bacterium]|nr:efflux RND transporter periplasmic adaptor subunit [Gemmatimonadota bacterium]